MAPTQADGASEAPLWQFVGERVALGPHRRELLPHYHRWITDPDVARTLAIGVRPMTFDDEVRWYEALASQPREVYFTVYERATARPIGVTALHDVDHAQRTAEFGLIIGEKDAWGKGYATETARMMLDYAFHALNLHNIMLTVYGNNPGALIAYERAGFRRAGVRRQARWIGDQAIDVIWMDSLATEFTGSVLRQRLLEGRPPAPEPEPTADKRPPA
jgi:RimJ/RimL family protein N-acetyltransferase